MWSPVCGGRPDAQADQGVTVSPLIKQDQESRVFWGGWLLNFFSFGHPEAQGAPGPGIRSEPQLQLPGAGQAARPRPSAPEALPPLRRHGGSIAGGVADELKVLLILSFFPKGERRLFLN